MNEKHGKGPSKDDREKIEPEVIPEEVATEAEVEYAVDAEMIDLEKLEIPVGEEERNAFLGISPNVKIPKKTRQLGARLGRLDRLEFSGNLCFSGESKAL